MSELSFSWTCHCCGQEFESLPLNIGADFPLNYYAVPEGERAGRIKHTEHFCVIDNDTFFVRGCIDVPVIGHDQPFSWGLWVSVSDKSFAAISAAWDSPDRDRSPPYFGWLNAHLSCYPDTINLKTRLHLRPSPLRPFIELEPTNHPLAVEQRDGMTLERVAEVVAAYVEHGDAAARTK